MQKRLSIYQVAKRYSVAATTIFAWRNKGWIIPPKRIGGRVYWPESELDEWDAQGNPRPCDQKEEIDA